MDGKIVRIVDRGALRDLYVQVGSKEDFDFQVTLPSHVVRDLDLLPGVAVAIGLKKPSLWVIPGREKSDAPASPEQTKAVPK